MDEGSMPPHATVGEFLAAAMKAACLKPLTREQENVVLEAARAWGDRRARMAVWEQQEAVRRVFGMGRRA